MHANRICRRHEHPHAGHRILFGIAVIGVGVLALLDNLRFFDVPLLRTFWPLALSLFGLGRLISGRHYGQWLFGMGLVVFGVLLTADHLGLLQFRPRDWWPVLIILVGLSIVTRGLLPKPQRALNELPDHSTLAHGDRIDIDASFSAINQQNDSRSFKGGRIDMTFGGVELDLRQAVIDGPEAVLQISARFSGIKLLVPRDWQIIVNVAPTLGGVDDKTVPPMNPTQRLVLRGDAVFGGVEIRN